jgi:undecaprenyl-diphosphatase
VAVLGLDAALTHWVNSFAGISPAFDSAWIFLAKWAIYVLVATMALRWWILSPRLEQRFIAVSCGLSTLLSLGFNQGILQFIDRVRPYDQGVSHAITARSVDPSFPSDHATVVFAIAFTLHLQSDRFAWAYGLAAVLVSVSRVYVGLHFVGDIVGSAATALVAAFVVNAIYRRDWPINRFIFRLF